MLFQLPRLTNALREPFDADQAYLHRKAILQNFSSRSTATSLEESELARKIVYQWDQASPELRQAYKHFVGAVVELMKGEVVSEEFREVAFCVYRLFSGTVLEDEEHRSIAEKKSYDVILCGNH